MLPAVTDKSRRNARDLQFSVEVEMDNCDDEIVEEEIYAWFDELCSKNLTLGGAIARFDLLDTMVYTPNCGYVRKWTLVIHVKTNDAYRELKEMFR